MALWSLLRRSPDPASWTELWQVLAPLGGRTGQQDLERFGQALPAMPPELRYTAQKQLSSAILLLDTEENARHLRAHPWNGPYVPFRRAAFIRVLQSVIAAGPEATNAFLPIRVSSSTLTTRIADLKRGFARKTSDIALLWSC